MVAVGLVKMICPTLLRYRPDVSYLLISLLQHFYICLLCIDCCAWGMKLIFQSNISVEITGLTLQCAIAHLRGDLCPVADCDSQPMHHQPMLMTNITYIFQTNQNVSVFSQVSYVLSFVNSFLLE